MSGETRAAYTKHDPLYPGFINVTEDESSITITMRGDPKVVSGSFLCGFAHERGLPGRCTPGDPNCNNYCNHDDNQPMPDSPAPSSQTICGDTVQLTLTKLEWLALKGKF
jgi:hypothetical protein